jgi:flagellar basal-body rod protein FlgB
MMIESTEKVTVDLLKLALDASSLRQQALANNIANAGTPGYVPVRVNFETQLDALRRSLAGGEKLEAGQLRGVAPVLERAPAGSTVALDMEAAAMAENSTRYNALLKALNKHLSIMSTAINEGKR